MILVASSLNAMGSYHVLVGGKAGYQFSKFDSKQLDNFFDNFNEQENRKIHSEENGSKLEAPTSYNGFYIEYSIYKYLDKKSLIMLSYDLSCYFDYQKDERSWDFYYENIPEFECSRHYDSRTWSLGVDYSLGISPIKNYIISLGTGISYERFDLKTYLSIPRNLPSGITKSNVLDYENNFFTMDDPNSNEDPFTTHADSTSMQNGTFETNGGSIKVNLKNEYFINNNIAINLDLNYKFTYYGRLKNDDDEKLRESQDSQKNMKLYGFSYFVRFGLSYYFLME